MALKDNAVVTAAEGFVFTNVVGAAAPTPSQLASTDPERFGCQVLTLKVTGVPTSYTLTVGAGTTSALLLASTVEVVQAALEGLTTVGAGNVIVEGDPANIATTGLSVTVLGEKQGETLTITGTATGGTTPAVVVTVATASNGWKNIGHTSRDDMPEFGFDGGDTTVKGTWQKKRLREVQTGDPVADSVKLNLQQWDVDTMELYFGENASTTPGVFGVSGDFVPVEKSLLVIIVDGDVSIGFYAPKASIKRDDSLNLPVDEFSSLPVKATFLNLGARRLYDWISALFS